MLLCFSLERSLEYDLFNLDKSHLSFMTTNPKTIIVTELQIINSNWFISYHLPFGHASSFTLRLAGRKHPQSEQMFNAAFLIGQSMQYCLRRSSKSFASLLDVTNSHQPWMMFTIRFMGLNSIRLECLHLNSRPCKTRYKYRHFRQ